MLCQMTRASPVVIDSVLSAYLQAWWDPSLATWQTGPRFGGLGSRRLILCRVGVPLQATPLAARPPARLASFAFGPPPATPQCPPKKASVASAAAAGKVQRLANLAFELDEMYQTHLISATVEPHFSSTNTSSQSPRPPKSPCSFSSFIAKLLAGRPNNTDPAPFVALVTPAIQTQLESVNGAVSIIWQRLSANIHAVSPVSCHI